MKKCLIFLLMTLFAFSSVATERKKVGLVLGGGGAKGVAHIGVLKVLEEAGIPIDYIAGTSMGAIVGGLYSIGYAPAEIDSMVSSLDWQMLLSDKVQRSNLSFPEKENSERYIISIPFGKEKKDRFMSGVIKGQNLQNLFSSLTIGYHDSVDFNSFHIPFACVALDIVDGKEKVFHEGSLPTSMRASMAIPAVFTPVRLDSMVLVDGGLCNNYPADVARAMDTSPVSNAFSALFPFPIAVITLSKASSSCIGKDKLCSCDKRFRFLLFSSIPDSTSHFAHSVVSALFSNPDCLITASI